jgi:hypothetical protein
MFVAMGLSAVPTVGMYVCVVRIMPVLMGMGERFMHMGVRMALTYMQPHTTCHQQRGQPEHHTRHSGPHHQRYHHAK